MTSLTGEFQTDLSLPDVMVACTEAIDDLGWHVQAVEPNRIVSYTDADSEHPPKIEVLLEESGQATDVRITGSDADAAPLAQDALIAELDRARDAIKVSLEDAIEAPPQGPPAGWYPDSRDRGKLRYWDGQDWTNQVHPASEAPSAQPAPAKQASRSAEGAGAARVGAAPTRSGATGSADPTRKSIGRRGIRPHWRKMTWVLIIWSALILLWAITGAAANECANEPTTLEQDACEAGTGIGVALILLIGFFGFAFFSLIWFMTRPRGRECPACGERVKKGQTTCPACGHDFAAAATGGPLSRAASG